MRPEAAAVLRRVLALPTVDSEARAIVERCLAGDRSDGLAERARDTFRVLASAPSTTAVLWALHLVMLTTAGHEQELARSVAWATNYLDSATDP